MTDAPGAGAPRPWHLSDVHLTEREPVAAIDDLVEGDGTAADFDGGIPPATAPRPLWYRVVTGQSIAWRLRGIRRRWAHRGVRWLGLHPELRTAAYERGLRGVVGFVVHGSWKGPERHSLWYRSEVEVGDRVVAAGAQPSAMLTDVDVRSPEGAEHVLTVSDSDPFVVSVEDLQQHVARLLAPIDLRVWNPTGFPYNPSTWGITLEPLVEGDDEQVTRRRLLVARQARSLRCNFDTSHHPEQIARWIVDLAAAGAPLIGDVSSPVRDLVGDRLSELITGVDESRLRSQHERELHSLRLRRCALSEFSARGRWRQVGDDLTADVRTSPQISVLLPSNRPGDVIDAARQVAAQRNVDVQLIVGLHGAHMPGALDAQIAEVFPGDLVVRHLPRELSLGQVMNELTAQADRSLVSKWDDDDWYDVDHLADLVLAMEYSGATMVGKAAEFVRLESIDVTIRRLASAAERSSTTIAGGALMIARADLERVGWADVPREVDRRLIEALERTGMTTYRTHGFGYVLRRRSGPTARHTWVAGDDYFLRQAQDQRPGLDLHFAGFAPEVAR